MDNFVITFFFEGGLYWNVTNFIPHNISYSNDMRFLTFNFVNAYNTPSLWEALL